MSECGRSSGTRRREREPVLAVPGRTRRLALTRRGLCAGLLASVAASGRARAQEPEPPPAAYPTLPREAASPQGFVPEGWAIEREASGDVDGDGIGDAVFVMRQRAPRNILRPYGPDGPALDTNPRLLVVASGRREGGPYRLALANHTLIPRHETITVEDPFGEESRGLETKRGAFSVWLHRFAAAGGRDMGHAKLTFRLAGSRCELIGFERLTVDRFGGETVMVSVNYSTGRIRRETGHIGKDETRVVWARRPKSRLLAIEEVGDGLAFDPESPHRA